MPCRDETLAQWWHRDEALIGTNTSPSGVSSHSPVWAQAERKTNVLIRGLFQCHSSRQRRMRWGRLQGKQIVDDDERKMDVSAVLRVSNGDFMSHRKLSEGISFNEAAFLFPEDHFNFCSEIVKTTFVENILLSYHWIMCDFPPLSHSCFYVIFMEFVWDWSHRRLLTFLVADNYDIVNQWRFIYICGYGK